MMRHALLVLIVLGLPTHALACGACAEDKIAATYDHAVVQPRSVRVSAQPAALSFAVAPGLQSPREAVAALQRALGSSTRLTELRAMPQR